MLKYRMVSFPLLLALTVAVFYFDFTDSIVGKVGFPVLLALLSVPLALEIDALLRLAGLETVGGAIPAVTVAAMVCIFPLSGRFLAVNGYDTWPVDIAETAVTTGWVVAGWLFVLLARDHGAAFRKAAGTLASTMFVLALMMPFHIIYRISPWWFLFFILATKAYDTGGYIAGMLSGKLMKNGNHKLAPSISPAKSWEGLAGGAALSLVAGCGFAAGGALGLHPAWVIALSLVLCIGSMAGDLSESALKRACGVKDSGNLIPGMGGMLDLFDSFIYNGPVLAVVLGRIMD